jgi:hypothetical protein
MMRAVLTSVLLETERDKLSTRLFALLTASAPPKARHYQPTGLLHQVYPLLMERRRPAG